MKRPPTHLDAIRVRHREMVHHSQATVVKCVLSTAFLYLSTQVSTVLSRSGAELAPGDYFFESLLVVGALLAARSAFKSGTRLLKTSDIVLVPWLDTSKTSELALEEAQASSAPQAKEAA